MAIYGEVLGYIYDGAAYCDECIGETTDPEVCAILEGQDTDTDEPVYCDTCNVCVVGGQFLELMIDGSWGIYVPQRFTEKYDRAAWEVSQEDWNILAAGPEHEHYWEAWDNVLLDCGFTDRQGNHWSLYQEGDLFASRLVEPGDMP